MQVLESLMLALYLHFFWLLISSLSHLPVNYWEIAPSYILWTAEEMKRCKILIIYTKHTVWNWLYSCARMCSVLLHFGEEHCVTVGSGVLHCGLLKSILILFPRRQELVWSWVISLRSLPTWITSCFYEDLCGCCAQIGNSCIASVKLCAERQKRNSSVKVFASERHEVPVNLLDPPWKWTGTWTCPHCWWCPLTCWDCSVPSYWLFIRPLNNISPSVQSWGMPLVTDYQLDFVLLTTRPSQFSAHLISAHPELPFLFFSFSCFFLLRQMNSFYMNLSV